MKNIILLFVLLIPLISNSQFSSNTVKRIDEIRNNTGTDLLLNPSDKVDINYFTGEKALQSTADGELEESSITNAELGYLTGTTSNIQTQIDSKQAALTGTDGDLYYWNSGLANLGIGTNGQVLQVSALGFPSWADAPVSTTLDTKGQLQGFSTVNANVGPCTDDQILVYDNLEATGWKCSALPSTSPTTTLGDLIYNNTGTAAGDTRLGIGTAGQLLTVNGGIPSWEDAPVSTTLTNKGDIQTHNGTANASLPVGVDNSFLVADSNEATGLKWSESITGLISQAQMVGTAKQTPATNCIYTVGSSGSFTAPPTQPLCNDFEVTGGITFADLKQPQFTIDNARTDGVYVVRLGAVMALNFEAVNAVGEAKLNIDGEQVDFVQVIKSSQSAYIRNYRLQGFKRFVTGGDKLVQITMKTSVGNTNPMIITNRPANDNLFFTVEFYPDSNSLAAIQNKELTAETANELTAFVDSSGNVLVENYDFLNGNCSNPTTGNYTCNFNPGIFTTYPICLVNGNSNIDTRIGQIVGASSSQVLIEFKNQNGTEGNVGFYIQCSKQGADVNKSQVIAGTFEQIEEVNVTLDETNANELSAVIDESALITSSENYNWIGSVSESVGGRYVINFNSVFTVIPSCVCTAIGGGGTERGCMVRNDISTTSAVIETYNASGSLARADFNLVCSKQGADVNKEIKGAVVQASSLAVECQTKTLTADITSDADGNIDDLDFNNLEIGKKYKLITSLRVDLDSATTISAQHNNGAQVLAKMFVREGMTSPNVQFIIPTEKTEYFTATNSFLEFIVANTSGGRAIRGNGSTEQSKATLCELPDNYIINSTKFN